MSIPLTMSETQCKAFLESIHEGVRKHLGVVNAPEDESIEIALTVIRAFQDEDRWSDIMDDVEDNVFELEIV